MNIGYATWGIGYNTAFREFAEEAASNAHADLENPQRPKHRGADGEILTYTPHAVAAVWNSVLTLEAGIKEISIWYQTGFMGQPILMPASFEKKSLAKKWAMLPQVIVGQSFDERSDLWKRFVTLIWIRNKITHFQWRVDEVPEIMKELVARDLVIPAAPGIYWFEAMLTNRVACWAVETIGLMFTEITKLLGQGEAPNWAWHD